MSKFYDRDGRPLTLLEWAVKFESVEYHVGATHFHEDGVEVSTVWLGADHNYGPTGPPLIFETMIFGGTHDGWTRRYSTLAEAQQGHAAAVAAIDAGKDPG